MKLNRQDRKMRAEDVKVYGGLHPTRRRNLLTQLGEAGSRNHSVCSCHGAFVNVAKDGEARTLFTQCLLGAKRLQGDWQRDLHPNLNVQAEPPGRPRASFGRSNVSATKQGRIGFHQSQNERQQCCG